MSDTAADQDGGNGGGQPQAHDKPAARPGLFTRLFGKRSTGGELEIAIAPFMDALGQDHARSIAQPFQNLDGVRVRTLREQPILGPDIPRAEHLPQACAQAMGWITKHNADLVLWGDIPPPGTTLFIHFAAAPPADADPAGTIPPFQALTLPVGFTADAFGGLLLAAALAAVTPQTQAKRQYRRALVAGALERAAQNVEHIPGDFTVRERASVHAAYANALAAFAHLFPGTEVYHRAALAYAQALKGAPKSDNPTNWAYLQRNLGAMLQTMGERTDNAEILRQAAKAYRAALEVFTYETTPFPWATTQNHLGEVLYRLDIKSGETAGLKEALGSFQSALKVLSMKSTPLLWSETLNNLGLAAQVLGRELNNAEVAERAVAACDQALKVRKRDEHPTLWATTQNNLGSALFLLGRMSGEAKYFEHALEAFMGAREVYEALGLARMVEVTDKNIQHAQERLPAKDGRGTAKDPSMWWLEEDEDAKP